MLSLAGWQCGSRNSAYICLNRQFSLASLSRPSGGEHVGDPTSMALASKAEHRNARSCRRKPSSRNCILSLIPHLMAPHLISYTLVRCLSRFRLCDGVCCALIYPPDDPQLKVEESRPGYILGPLDAGRMRSGPSSQVPNGRTWATLHSIRCADAFLAKCGCNRNPLLGILRNINSKTIHSANLVLPKLLGGLWRIYVNNPIV